MAQCWVFVGSPGGERQRRARRTAKKKAAGERICAMPRAEDLLRSKSDRCVAWVSPDTTALDAAKRMNEKRIGSLVVLDHRGELCGIITERDILTRVVAAERAPEGTLVREVMTPGVLTCERETRLKELKRLMTEQRVRHVPVVEDKRVVGIISIGDLNAAEQVEMVQTIQYLEQWIAPT